MVLANASVVAIKGQALFLEGPPGSGKSTLALALIDRGAKLIGDDGAILERTGNQVHASPPPNIQGKLEIRGVGLVNLPLAPPTPLALILTLGGKPDRLPNTVQMRDVLGVEVPCMVFDPGTIAPAIRAEWALSEHGLGFGHDQ